MCRCLLPPRRLDPPEGGLYEDPGLEGVASPVARDDGPLDRSRNSKPSSHSGLDTLEFRRSHEILAGHEASVLAWPDVCAGLQGTLFLLRHPFHLAPELASRQASSKLSPRARLSTSTGPFCVSTFLSIARTDPVFLPPVRVPCGSTSSRVYGDLA